MDGAIFFINFKDSWKPNDHSQLRLCFRLIDNFVVKEMRNLIEGPVVLFLHGFSELWYSLRHQLLSLSVVGYRANASNLRGYGDTDAPPSASSYSALHIVVSTFPVLSPPT
ncbi:hypothetical protein V8G54_006249 [Vigna mungo]|uniref:AB hydrolase-1 domain-containing protein n=1 Tax=Vigna mungo TaxID=3915 RepID=A0AAQ3P1K2_VIGMU